MLKQLKNALSTRKAMQHTPAIDLVHELTDEELHSLQSCFLQMLKDFDAVCKKYDICYMAAGGTCLGSVRHKGFIPWDDDVDVIMPREDLKKFLSIFEEAMGDQYEMTSPNSQFPLESMISAFYKKNTLKATFEAYNTDLPKGVHVDIFAIDSVPTNKVARWFKGYSAMVLQYIAVSSLMYRFRNREKKEFFFQTTAGKINYCIRMTTGFLFSFRDYRKWAASFDNFVQSKQDTGLWAVPTDIGHYFGHIMKKEVYYPPIQGEFEDMQINLPHDPDAYLKNQYGDYMRIPPVEDREKHWSIGFSLDIAGDMASGKMTQEDLL